MKILLVHYRYFVAGGPERYMFNITDLLESNGHTVIPFSVKHKKNSSTAFEKYFIDPVGEGHEVYGHEYKRNFKTISKVISRMLYSFEAKKKLKKLIALEKPDLVYVLQFQNKISCSVIDAAYDMKVPIVQRISDFAHICVTNIFYHYQTQSICEKCLKGANTNAIPNKCADDSIINSVLKWTALRIQDIRKTRKKISKFIIPSPFTVEKFVEFGLPQEKIINIPTFFNPVNIPATVEYGDFFLYVGRVDPDKGLLTLINAFIGKPEKLIIVGHSIDGYDDFLKEHLVGKTHNITFTGKLDFPAIKPYLERCIATICPSEWYDNLPNSVLESYAFKKPVIASRLGSLKHLITDELTGLHFEAKNSEDLYNKVLRINNNILDAERMGKLAYERLVNEYSANYHYTQLVKTFESVIANQR